MIINTRITSAIFALFICRFAQAEECEKILSVKFPKAEVTQAILIEKEMEIAGVGEANLMAPVTFCRVHAVARPSSDSEIHVEVWIPEGSDWNQKFEQVGNGGFGGKVLYRSMLNALSRGYAVAGTDDGHQSNDVTDASWALHHPEKITDYSWRAISETTQIAKRVVAQFKGRQPSHSYFNGCSAGGREALMMAQRFPDFFEGIIAGAPAINSTRIMIQGKRLSEKMTTTEGHLSPAKLTLLQSQAQRQCGNGLSYLRDPMSCRVDLTALECTGAESDSCLTKAQIENARSVYQDRKEPSTGTISYGVMPGAEAVKGSWDIFLTGMDQPDHALLMRIARNYFAYMVIGDPNQDLNKISDADLLRSVKEFSSKLDSSSPDLSAFRMHGGKLLQYHGWNDPLIPAGYSLEYQARLIAKMGDVGDFYRLYMVPGMLHCLGGDAPTLVDWEAALESWVEQGDAPQTLVARDGKGAVDILTPFQGTTSK